MHYRKRGLAAILKGGGVLPSPDDLLGDAAMRPKGAGGAGMRRTFYRILPICFLFYTIKGTRLMPCIGFFKSKFIWPNDNHPTYAI